MRSGGSWRWTVFWSAFVVLYAVYAARLAYELLRPVLPALACLTGVIAALWLLLAWRRSRY